MTACHSSIAEILRGSRHADDGPDYVAMFWAYLDDSSDPKRERFCAAGGLFSLDLRWQKFESAWLAATRNLSEPFRSTDCECGHGQFKHWPKPKRDQLMADLCVIIRDHDLGAFGSCVAVPDYRAVFPDADEHDPYLLCVGLCFANLAEINHIANSVINAHGLPLRPTTIRYWVEESRDTAARATQIYHDIKALTSWGPSHAMASISHLGKEIVGLQAADLLAREVFKFYDNRGVRPVRKPVITLAQQVTFFCWTPENLKEFALLSTEKSYAEALAIVAQAITASVGTPIVSPDGSMP